MKQGQIRPFRRTRPVPIRRGATGSFAHSRAFGAGFFPPFGFGSFFLRRCISLCANPLRTRGARGGSELNRTLRLRGDANQCASDTLADLRVQKPKNFLAFFLRLLPPTPPPRSGKRNGKEIFGFASPFQLHYIISL